MSAEVCFRPIVPSDDELLCRIYASTRVEEMAQVGWNAEQVEAFVAMQHRAQHQYYQQVYPDGLFQVILREGVPVGRLYVARLTDEIRIVDIALLPEHRGQGIGGTILSGLIAGSEQSGLPLRIHVERFNPAMRLYERLGFRPIADRGVHLLMERPVDPGANAITTAASGRRDEPPPGTRP